MVFSAVMLFLNHNKNDLSFKILKKIIYFLSIVSVKFFSDFQVTETTVLKTGSRVIFGKNHVFRYNIEY
jgi:hypothetical protein